MSDSAINHVPDVFAPGHLGELTQIIPVEMVDAAIETAGGKERRVRKLPSRVVIYLLLAGVLFADQGWRQVYSRLVCGLSLPARSPAASTLSQAMRRVGVAPLRELFTFVKGPAVAGSQHTTRFAGRLVVAIDGTQLAVADTEANRARYPKARSGPNGEPGYPMIRLVAILTAGTRSVIEAAFGTDAVGELTYARQITSCLHPGMVLLGDRNFATYGFFRDVAQTGADFLFRAKTGSNAMKLPVLRPLSDGSYLSSAAGQCVRVIDAVLTVTTEAGTRSAEYRLVTTMLDPLQAPAHALTRLYHQRWEIETAYCELKSRILGGRVLRGRHPGAVIQETWALLTCYQVLRTAMTDAALQHPGIDPDRLSFSIALRTARDQVVHAYGTAAGATIDLIGRIGTAILAEPLPARRIRTRPRVIKRAISKYRAKERNVDRRTYPATLTTRILTPNPRP
ncbi:IS4 family transposase (plasmid) [Pseudarthrobacter sp. O4]|uniref:IS4 family transposase n=1 Tax=Pseudarthrobacter sp. O4 TaxID=3418417 RepID=UPI003CF02C2D